MGHLEGKKKCRKERRKKEREREKQEEKGQIRKQRPLQRLWVLLQISGLLTSTRVSGRARILG